MGAGMTYQDLQDRAAELADLEGYSDAASAPDWADLVNKAYTEFVWETETNRATDTALATVASQADYALPAPDFKTLLSVYVDSVPMSPASDRAIRRDPYWFTTTAGTSQFYYRPKPSTLRLWPTPATGALAIVVYGVRAPDLLVAAGDEPEVPDVYHESIAKRAYWMAAERWARGDARQALMDQVEQYVKRLNSLKGEFAAEGTRGVSRMALRPIADRVQL
jgi:hypothetical protein